MVRAPRPIGRSFPHLPKLPAAVWLALCACTSKPLEPKITVAPENDAAVSVGNTQPVSIWSTSPMGADTTSTDERSVELGIKFKSSVAGQIVGVRFYKGAGNDGIHTATLWDATTRERLSDTVPFISETAAGWQTALFPLPVNIAAEHVYVASYHAPKGHYAFTAAGLDSGVDAAPLQALAGAADPNGVFSLGSTSQFPDQCFGNANYWVDVLFTTGATFTIWPAAATPASATVTDDRSLELGVRFRTDIDGRVAGVRFYKGATNTDVHTGTLWTEGRSIMATATFLNETAEGWQTVKFAEPVSILAGRTYVASYHTLHGHYAFDSGGLAAGRDSGYLHALASVGAGGNGVYALDGESTWSSFNDSNYWVDVVFSP
jgi:hypothetical protein